MGGGAGWFRADRMCMYFMPKKTYYVAHASLKVIRYGKAILIGTFYRTDPSK